MTRTYAYAEAMAQSASNTSTTFTDGVSVTFTPGSSETWAFFFACEVLSDNSTDSVAARLNHDTASVVLENAKLLPIATTAWLPFAGCQFVTFGASPGSQTVSLEYARGVAASFNTYMRDATLLAIKMTGNDAGNKPGTTPTNASTTYTDIATFTAPANGTYDIFGSVELTTTNPLATPNGRFLLEDNSTAAYTFNLHFLGSGTISNYYAHVRRTLTTGQTVKLQFNRPSGTSTQTATNGCIVGFDIAGFDNKGTTTDTTSRNTASAAYVQRNAASTLTFTPSFAVDHFLWGAAGIDMGATSNNPRGSIHAKFAGTEYQAVDEPGSTGSSPVHMVGAGAVINLPTSSTTLTWEYGYLDASPTTTSQFATIGWWQLGPSSVAYTAAATGTEDSTASAVAFVGWHAAASGTQASTGSVGALANRGKLSGLFDDFSGTLAKWSVGTSGATIVSGHLDLPYSSGVAKVVTSVDLWDATNSRAMAQFSSVVAGSQCGLRIVQNAAPTSNFMELFVRGDGELVARCYTAGVASSLDLHPYSSTHDAWWQITESGGVFTVFTSPNGVDATWVPWGSFAHSWDATNIRPELWTIGA